ncbi:EBNA3C nuclear protein [human gammaherpesvirus 4]|uniref:Epstein-Barr nuclear antigen 6 n=7 Tax=Epstein-Barr virus (strain GD1) TaxID=10376 RepID=EBNA6_EBVA8|nr:EBNA-3C [Human herpesvirus 4 type 2]Q69140.1 RecName: Full=Epstein-Barr nuclear antigen 6; Short=EBNA-6; Short=EBV nuclear antigen 6; AltName: Full=Epstein-Barr nuclear antigen 3C; Short=EBNA-3C; Short=EBV nuclear antigen 3C; AltName: Full=Epstein-Barr nuclear antigen 4B; Short=EBNA-4B; Short=EBV nuclear antigen 4B [Epstein-barr virus strain ag876]AAA45895.1 nuclear antigen EBNA-3C [human gammaherpesvirus 4]ABB89245.1 EBNA-3C [human gammaherpesvirus 4]ATO60384.1 EBNA3C nuclear protein [human
MESFEGEGDSIQSPDNARGDDVQNTGEHIQDPGPGPSTGGASEGLVQNEPDSRDQQSRGQRRGDENRGWMQRIRRRRRRRAALSGHLLDMEDNVPPWFPPHDITPYVARNIRDAACQAVKHSHLQALSNLILDSGLDTQHLLCFVMAARQRLQDIRRGPLVVEGGVGWRHWLLTSPSRSWSMGYRTATLRTLTPVPNRVGADSIMLTATFGCQNGALAINTFSATVWIPPPAGPREQERYAREAEVRFLRGKWQRRFRRIFDLIELCGSLHHVWQNMLQTEENLLDFVRFMGVMSSCNSSSVNYWFHKTIGNFKPYYPWNAPPNENPYHARRGIKEQVIQKAFLKAQRQGLSMLATGGGPRGDATSETSSDEDTGRQGSDVELESSDDELPYIDPNMEPVQQRPVMFVSRVPVRKPRTLPWPTPKTHPVKRTIVKTSYRSDEAEEAQSTPERPGPSKQPSEPVEPAHTTPAGRSTVILHEPPREPEAVSFKPPPPPSRRRRGACVVYDDDIIEVIDVETTEEETTSMQRQPPLGQQPPPPVISTGSAMSSSHTDPSVTQPSKPHRKPQDGFQRSGRRQKRAMPPPVSPSDAGPPSTRPRVMAPPSTGPRVMATPSTGPRDMAPPSTGPRDMAPPSTGPRDMAPPSTGPRDMAPTVVHMFTRERLLTQSTGPAPRSFWEMRAGRDAPKIQQEPSSQQQPATQSTPPCQSWVPSVYVLPAVDAGNAQPLQISHLSSMSPTQPISHEEQPRYEDPDTPLDLSLHPDTATLPPTQDLYPGREDLQATQAPYPGYEEPRPPQAPFVGDYGFVQIPSAQWEPHPSQGTYQGHIDPQLPAALDLGPEQPRFPQDPYVYSGGQLSSCPGYAGPWPSRPQHPRYRHTLALWPREPRHGHSQGPWKPWSAHLPPQWDGSAGHGQDQVSQFPHLHSETGPPRLQLSSVPQVLYPQPLVSSSAPSWSSPQPRAPIRPIPTRFPPPPMPLQDSMAVGCDSSGTACPSMPFASDYSQGAFTPLDINAPTPKSPRVEESSHGPARCSQATSEAQEILSDNSEISVFPKDAKQTDYDASTESELD